MLAGTWEIGLVSKSVRALPAQQSLPLLSSTSEPLLAQNPPPSLLQFGSEGPEVQSVQALLQLLGYYSGQIDGRYQESTVIAVSAFQKAAGLNEDGIIGPTTWEKLLPSVAQVDSNRSVVPSSAVSTIPTPSSPVSSDTPTPQSEADGSETISSTDTPESSSVTDVTESEVENETPTEASTNPVSEDIRLPTLRLGMRGPAVRSLQERLSSLGLLQGTVDGVFGSQTEESVKSAQRYFNLTPDGVVGPATWSVLLQ